MPTTELQLTIDRREMASILAGLRLLYWSGFGNHGIPYTVARMVDEVTEDGGAFERLTDAELRELIGRLA